MWQKYADLILIADVRLEFENALSVELYEPKSFRGTYSPGSCVFRAGAKVGVQMQLAALQNELWNTHLSGESLMRLDSASMQARKGIGCRRNFGGPG
nr:hypothetical protein [Halomonas populi]